ncbi:MAG: hypothetical protein ACFFCZ_26075 [Promethearchaeota archaeon]
MAESGLPILQAKIEDLEITKVCEECNVEASDTPLDQIVICPNCKRLYYVEYPIFSEFLTFEKQLYASTMVEYLLSQLPPAMKLAISDRNCELVLPDTYQS